MARMPRRGTSRGRCSRSPTRPQTWSERCDRRWQRAMRSQAVVKQPPADEDVDAHRRAREDLRESEERLRLALEAGQMGTWEWTVATNEVIWSPSLEAIHGLAPGTFAGTFAAYREDIHPEDREQVLGAIAETVERGEDHHVEYRIVRPDGGIRWVEGRGKLVRDASGAALRMIGVCMDVTERKQNEERQKLLLDELNHRVRNMLAIIQSIAGQTLRETPEA